MSYHVDYFKCSGHLYTGRVAEFGHFLEQRFLRFLLVILVARLYQANGNLNKISKSTIALLVTFFKQFFALALSHLLGVFKTFVGLFFKDIGVIFRDFHRKQRRADRVLLKTNRRESHLYVHASFKFSTSLQVRNAETVSPFRIGLEAD
jgi:hypothetical protein